MTRTLHPGNLLAALAVAFTLALPAAGQRPGSPDVTLGGGFRAPIHDGNRVVALVTGREVKPSLAAGQVLIGTFRLETYRYAPDRQTELTVESPSALFDPRGAASDRELTLSGADGRVAVTGQGWSWDRTSGLLIVSNRVQATLRQRRTATDPRPVEIASRRLEYNLKTGVTRFLGDCIATEPGRARITAGELRSTLSTETERPDAITATNGVVVELLAPGREGRAAGTGAAYAMTADGEQIEILGQPTWQFGPGTGAADRLLLLPGQDAYRARGHARLRLRTESPSAPGEASDASPRRDRAPMDITCDTIEATPGEVVLSGPVTLVQSNALHLTARRVVAELALDARASRENLHRVTATGDVTARLPAGGVTFGLQGQEMIYTTGEHAMVEVTGEPRWSAPGYGGTGGRFVIHPELPTFQVLDGVEVLWHAADPAEEASAIRVRADRLRAEAGIAQLRGGVQVSRDSWNLAATEADLGLATNAVLRRIEARGGVTLEYASSPRPAGDAAPDPSAPRIRLGAFLRDVSEPARWWTIRSAAMDAELESGTAELAALHATGNVTIDHVGLHAEGGRLVYRGANHRLRLEDEPQLHTMDGLHIVGEAPTAIVLDPQTDRFLVEGAVRKMTLPADALRGASTAHTAGRP